MSAKRIASLATALLIASTTVACDPSTPHKPSGADAGASPSASIRPRVLPLPEAGALDAAGAGIGRELRDASRQPSDAAPPPPTPLRANETLVQEPPSNVDPSGVRLEARWIWSDAPEPAPVPERSTEGIEAARALTTLQQRIEVGATGRMRVLFVGNGLPLPARTELRARYDRLGALLVWPSGKHYRLLVPGTLRGLYGERRVDVSPFSKATLHEEGNSSRLGVETRKLKLSSSLGHLRLELAAVPEAGLGAPLLCRMVVELVGLRPSHPVCRGDKVLPLAAQLFWKDNKTGKASMSFEITSLDRQAELSASALAFPPRRARLVPSGLPSAPRGVLLRASQLRALRNQGASKPAPAERGAPKEGLLAKNQGDLLLYLLLDGIPVAYVKPWSELPVLGPRNGRYSVQWRSFLGEVVGQVAQRDLPAKIVYGSLDAGVPNDPDGG